MIRHGTQTICEICGKESARIRRVTRTYGKGKEMFVIENILVVTCPHCGENYVEAETFHEIECIKLHKKSVATTREVRVGQYG